MEKIEVKFEIVDDNFSRKQKVAEVLTQEQMIKEFNEKLAEKQERDLKIIERKGKLANSKIILKANETINKIKTDIKLNQEISNLVRDWISTLSNMDIKNKELKTFTLRDIEKTSYGWKGRIYAPYGLNLENFETLKPFIDCGIGCNFFYEIPNHKQFALFKIVYPERVKCNDILFTPFKVKPWELYLGVDVTGKEILINVNKSPHLLIAGETGSGKNAVFDHIITSLVNNCSPDEIELIMFECAKNDFSFYEDLKHVKYFVSGDIEKMCEVCDYIHEEIERRKEVTRPMYRNLEGRNIYDYNKLHPNKKLKILYLLVDEIMVLKVYNRNKELNEMKSYIESTLEMIAEFGRAIGIFYVVAHQKPVKEFLNPILKNMSTVRLCFNFIDDSCGRAVLGEKLGHLAVGLPPRQAILMSNNKIDYLYTTNTEGRLKMFLQPYYIIKSRSLPEAPKKVEIVEDNKPSKKKQGSKISVEEVKEKLKEELIKKNEMPIESVTFDKVDPDVIKTKRDEYFANISKIPNFVPYQPSVNKVIIDQTNVPVVTEKPKRKES